MGFHTKDGVNLLLLSLVLVHLELLFLFKIKDSQKSGLGTI